MAVNIFFKQEAKTTRTALNHSGPEIWLGGGVVISIVQHLLLFYLCAVFLVRRARNETESNSKPKGNSW